MSLSSERSKNAVTWAHLFCAEDELLGHAAAHADVDVRRHLLPRPAVLILLRRLQQRHDECLIRLQQKSQPALDVCMHAHTVLDKGLSALRKLCRMP